LEFDDVILYNFFSDSELKENTWNLLKELVIEDETLSKAEFESKFNSNLTQLHEFLFK